MDTSKIIKGVVNSGRYTVTAPIVKEDYGLYLQIEGVELPSSYQVDFSNNENSGSSVTMIGNADGVLIPSQFISTGKDVFAFLYHVGEDYGRTVYKFRIPNKVRPDRTEDTPTPEEQSVIDQAISALNEAVEQTSADVASADQSAQSAESAKTAAESARDTAGEYANDAESSAASASTSASQASTSATASAQSASQSARIKADVEDLVDDAQGYAQASERSATASANSASQAQGYAQSASASAQSASGYASQAQTSAQTASAKAQDASTSAQTASTKATEASQSASQALTYKTDAETAKTASQTAQGLAESARDSAISAKEDAESARDTAQTLVDGISGKVEQIDSNTERIESLEDDRYKPYVVDSASGSIASFPDGADDLPLKSLVVNIDPVQDLSQGDPSPENICPISGWTEINVNHSDADTTNPTTITINLGQTVYGGKLDVLSGKLVVDRACENYDGSETGWGLQSINSYGIANFIHNATYRRSSMFATICNMFGAEQTSGIATTTNEGYLISANLYIYIRLLATKADTVDKFREWLQSNPIQISYELATPIEIQLTPNQVNSLLGVNNIWADSGDSEVEYRADTKLFIERLTAPDSADMIADANITSGQYFMVGNSLYKATANIANGSAIVVGTNCIRKSLSEALNEINA